MTISKIDPAGLDVGQIGGRRNKVINGNFDIWQRGTSFSNPDGSYTADRFKVVSGGATTGDSVSQQSFTVGQTDVPGEPEYYLRFSAGSTSSNKVMHHRIEDVRTGAGTLSAQAYSMTTSWQKFTFNFDMPSISGKTVGTSSYVYISFIRSLSASNVDIDIAQMQFEVGTVATPFEHRSYGEELALCERYFQTNYNTGDTVGSTGTGYLEWQRGSQNNSRVQAINLRSKMRANPTVKAYNQNDGTVDEYRDASTGTDRTAGSFASSMSNIWFDHEASNWNSMSAGNAGRMFITCEAEL